MNGLSSGSQSWQAASIRRSTARNMFAVLTFFTFMSSGPSLFLPAVAENERTSVPECCAHSAATVLKINDKAPDFSLPSQTGKTVKLSDYLGKSIVVVYFYPKDFTPICTKEGKAFRDSYESFKQAGAEVIGISADSIESHKSFAEEEHLPFILVSDSDDKVRRLWRVPNSMGFLPGRVTYVVDKRGIIRSVFDAPLEDKKHVVEALKVIDQLQKESAKKSK